MLRGLLLLLRETAMLRELLLWLRGTAAEKTAAIVERTDAERNCAITRWLLPRSLVAPRGGWRILFYIMPAFLLFGRLLENCGGENGISNAIRFSCKRFWFSQFWLCLRFGQF